MEKKMKPKRSCELCEEEASLYCEADSAFLCWACDGRVHSANFLVARHVRRIACSTCRSLDSGGRRITGAGSGTSPIRSICRFCDAALPSESSSESSSSSCISTAESTAEPERKAAPGPAVRLRRVARAEVVMGSWSRRMGLGNVRRCAGLAAHMLEACGSVMTGLPFRVAMAAALWFAVKFSEAEGGRTCYGLMRRLEACSGVPARLIVLAESRLARVAVRHHVAEEGWAECS